MSADIFPELDQSNGTKIQGIWGTQENGKAVICNIISQFNIKDRTRIEAYGYSRKRITCHPWKGFS